MAYSNHLSRLIDALKAARSDLSERQLAREAGVGLGWVSAFRQRGVASTACADKFVAAARRLCPAGPEGDDVRRLLAALDAERHGNDAGRAA